MRILVIEDDFISRNVISRFLAGFGEVVTADNGRLGLQALQTAHDAGTPFDLVTLDVMMPELDGHQVLQQLRQIEQQHPSHQKAKVVMTTALDDIQNVKTAYQGFCDDYLTKPIRKAVLFEKLQKLGFELPS